MEQKNKYYNHLQNEVSPYLLQHADNPVDWYPWGTEAFTKAKNEDKPVFLSIGYSTCHWCHVMAHESFEDPEVAQRMNDVFVCVKVDREERPDIDAVYMEAAQALMGSGGWPLSVILTPDQKPFFAATYLPKHTSHGQWGLMELCVQIRKLWTEERERVEETGEELTRWIREQGESSPAARPGRGVLRRTVEVLNRRFDPRWGGFGRKPKFPMPHMELFLLRYAALLGKWSGSGEMTADGYNALHMAEYTLEQMYRGGIFDHLGGGFSRYSTDDRWLVPHFEKMLYDNALLALTYTKAWELTEKPMFRRAAQETLEYMIRELQIPEGGFTCGQDADSDGEEGKYYVFARDEILNVLGNCRGEAYCEKFGVTKEGNWEGKNILHRRKDRSAEKWTERAMEEEDRRILYDYRKHRCQLHRDDKVLTAWNGMALAALSAAYEAFGIERYLQAAEEAALFLKREMKDESGRLFLRWKDGNRAVEGQLLDYACYAWGFLELYDVTWDEDYLEEASRAAELAVELFEDREDGGYFLYSGEGEQLISRPKETYDGAIPSGNSVMALVFVRLARLTGRELWIRKRDEQLRFLAGCNGGTGEGDSHWMGSTFGAVAAVEEEGPNWQLICVSSWNEPGKEREEQRKVQELVRRMRREEDNGAVLWKNSENELTLAKLAPMTVNYAIPERGVMYYYCRDGVCRTPVNSREELIELIHRK